MKKILIIGIVVVVVAGIAGAVFFMTKKPVIQFRTAEVVRGDIAVQVTATGTVNPRATVIVGTQVSGTVSKLFADYNQKVKKGQVVALLDPTFLAASVMDARASMEKARSQVILSNQNYSRTKALFDKGLVAQSDLDQAIADSISSKAVLTSANAQLDRARINLRYATIVSPISGTVINRNVEVGQTVAASFNTPTLFSIADDMSKMQVQASIDEADIGQVKEGLPATFNVDAYPGRTFTGTVSQVRLLPTTTQNVVTYTVMIDVDNKDMALFPGMTATITIEIKKAGNVLKVKNAALKITPEMLFGDKKRKWNPKDSSKVSGISKPMGMDTHGPFGGGAGNGGKMWRGKNPMKPRVFVLKDGKPVPVRVTTGLVSDGETEVQGDLEPGMLVVIGVQSSATVKNMPQSSPLGMGRPH